MRHAIYALILTILTLSFTVRADTVPPARIDVFLTAADDAPDSLTLQRQISGVEIRMHYIDGVERIEAMLSGGLSVNAEIAERTALSRLKTFGARERELLQQSADALVVAWQYAVRRYPAVVFDGRWVIYGVTNLEEAFAIFQERRAEGDR